MDRPNLPPRYARIDVEALVREYRDKIPVREIMARHELDQWSFYALLDRLNEPRRRPAGNRTRPSAAERLRRFTENEILKLERGLRADRGRKGTDDSVAKMMSLARTLEQIMKLQLGKAKGNDVAHHAEFSAITDERRRELARRLGALCRAPGFSEPAEGAA